MLQNKPRPFSISGCKINQLYKKEFTKQNDFLKRIETKKQIEEKTKRILQPKKIKKGVIEDINTSVR